MPVTRVNNYGVDRKTRSELLKDARDLLGQLEHDKHERDRHDGAVQRAKYTAVGIRLARLAKLTENLGIELARVAPNSFTQAADLHQLASKFFKAGLSKERSKEEEFAAYRIILARSRRNGDYTGIVDKTVRPVENPETAERLNQQINNFIFDLRTGIVESGIYPMWNPLYLLRRNGFERTKHAKHQ